MCFLRYGPSKRLKIIKNRQLFILFLEIQKLIKINQNSPNFDFTHKTNGFLTCSSSGPRFGLLLGSLFFRCTGFPTKTNGFCIIYVLHLFIPFSLRNIKFYAEKCMFLTFPTSEIKSRYFKFCHTSRVIFVFSTSRKKILHFYTLVSPRNSK